jgi:hypothetical protein
MINLDSAADIFAAIHQSSCDKLLASVDYPLTVLEKRQDFPAVQN